MPFFIFLFLFFNTSAIGAIYKCPDESGNIIYKDRPCADGEHLKHIIAAPKNHKPQPQARWPQEGMSKNDVLKIWGQPETTNYDSDGESWIYHRYNIEYVIFFKGEKVLTIWDDDGGKEENKRRTDAILKELDKKMDLAKKEEEMAENRRFISIGMPRDKVIGMIGKPDRSDFRGGEIMIYTPTHGDPQTETRIFIPYGGGTVADIKRVVKR